jgi:L-threonylcarbamoyladenylate synthase
MDDADQPPPPVQKVPVCRIVFVCTGNTCRSPLAEAICKKLLADRLACAVEELPSRGFVVQSAGLAATEGCAAAEEAIGVAASLGADLSRHQSRWLTPEMAEQATHLLGMTQGHVDAIGDFFPVQARLLSPDGEDVADPIGQPLPVYEACARQMSKYIEQLIAEIAPARG